MALTRAELAEVPDDALEQAVFDALVWSKRVGREPTEYQILLTLPEVARRMYATCVLEDEVDNGGLTQFFYNHDGRIALRAAEGYKLLGARRHAAVVMHAIRDFLRVRPHFDAAGAQRSWDAFAGLYKVGKLEALTERFREVGRHQDTRALRIKVIREQPEQFVAPR